MFGLLTRQGGRCSPSLPRLGILQQQNTAPPDFSPFISSTCRLAVGSCRTLPFCSLLGWNYTQHLSLLHLQHPVNHVLWTFPSQCFLKVPLLLALFHPHFFNNSLCSLEKDSKLQKSTVVNITNTRKPTTQNGLS